MTTVKIAENCKASADSPQDEKNLQHFQPFPANQKHYKNEWGADIGVPKSLILLVKRVGQMDVLQPFVPLGNSACAGVENDEFYSLFILSFSNKKGPPAGGWWLVTKTSEYGILGVGEGGC